MELAAHGFSCLHEHVVAGRMARRAHGDAAFGECSDSGCWDLSVTEIEARLGDVAAEMERAVVADDLLFDADGAAFRRAPSVRLAAGFAPRLLDAAAHREAAEAEAA